MLHKDRQPAPFVDVYFLARSQDDRHLFDLATVPTRFDEELFLSAANHYRADGLGEVLIPAIGTEWAVMAVAGDEYVGRHRQLEPPRSHEFEVVLEEAVFVLASVETEDGTPVPDCTVRVAIEQDGRLRNVVYRRTGADGAATLPIPTTEPWGEPGWVAVVSLPGNESEICRLPPLAPGVNPVTLSVAGGPRIRFRFLDWEGEPFLGRVLLALRDSRPEPIASGSLGLATASYQVTTEGELLTPPIPDMVPLTFRVEFDGISEEVHGELPPRTGDGGTQEFVVRAPNPQSGFLFSLPDLGEDEVPFAHFDYGHRMKARRAMPLGDSRYLVDTSDFLPEQTDYFSFSLFSPSAPAVGEATYVRVTGSGPPVGEIVDLGEFGAESPIVVAGQVVGAGGVPLEGARIRFCWELGEEPYRISRDVIGGAYTRIQLLTDSDGRFEVRGMVGNEPMYLYAQYGNSTPVLRRFAIGDSDLVVELFPETDLRWSAAVDIEHTDDLFPRLVPDLQQGPEPAYTTAVGESVEATDHLSGVISGIPEGVYELRIQSRTTGEVLGCVEGLEVSPEAEVRLPDGAESVDIDLRGKLVDKVVKISVDGKGRVEEVFAVLEGQEHYSYMFSETTEFVTTMATPELRVMLHGYADNVQRLVSEVTEYELTPGFLVAITIEGLESLGSDEPLRLRLRDDVTHIHVPIPADGLTEVRLPRKGPFLADLWHGTRKLPLEGASPEATSPVEVLTGGEVLAIRLAVRP